MSIAPLDRRVATRSNASQPLEIKRLSDLASEQYVVLLGEPGLGKTEAFKYFSTASGLECDEACLLDLDRLEENGTYFIDAIDEVSVEDAHQIAKALRRATGCKWRISCRAEDWNSGGRLSKVFGSQLAATGSEPVIAQLQPLDEEEAIAVLQAFEHPHPATVISTLQTLKSTPFVMTPLGLRFLMTVPPERLPAITRYQLYASGVDHLAREHNQAKAETSVPPAFQVVLDMAGRIFLTLLMTGKHGIKRIVQDTTTSLDLADIDIDSALANVVLDTALFTKKGDEFIPFHRSIQEFLAARYLARLVADGLGGARLHIERATALIVSADGLPSESLRPLYAWFICHLVNEGAIGDAKRLVERDPEAALLHGDAAKLPWEFRSHILGSMGGRDPYFKWTAEQWGPAGTCTVGLITSELQDQARLILEVDESLHRLLTVLDALSAGSPMPQLADACWSVVIRANTSFWCRKAAVTAWANCAKPSHDVVWGRIEDLSAGHEHLEAERIRVIAELFCLIPPDQLIPADVLKVLAAIESAISMPASGVKSQPAVSTIYAIRDICWHVAVPHLWQPLLLDAPKRWRLSSGAGSLQERFASSLCAMVLTHDANVTVSQFAKMMLATGSLFVSEVTVGYKPVAANWVSARADHEEIVKALLLLADEDIANAGSIARGLRGLGLQPTMDMLRWMLTQEQLLKRLGASYVGVQAACWVLEPTEDAPSWLIELLGEVGDTEVSLVVKESIAGHAEEIDQTREQARQANQFEDQLVAMAAQWALAASSIESGENTDALIWGAEVYSGNRPLSWVQSAGTKALEEAFGHELAPAYLKGLASVLLEDKEWEWISLPRAVATAILLEQQHQILSAVPVKRVLDIFFAARNMRDIFQKEQVENYCIERLNQALDACELQQLADARGTFWNSFLEKLGNNLTQTPLHSWAARIALAQPQSLSGATLHSVLSIAKRNLPVEELAPIIKEMLGDQQHEPKTGWHALREAKDRLQWAFLGVTLDPSSFADAFGKILRESELRAIHDELASDYKRRIAGVGADTALLISKVLLSGIIQLDPEMSSQDGPQWPDVSAILRILSTSEEPNVEAFLQELLDQSRDTKWVGTFQHELERYRRDIRAQFQRPVATLDLVKIFGGRGPVDAKDLRALVTIVLEEIATGMQSSSLNPWRLYWDQKVQLVKKEQKGQAQPKEKQEIKLTPKVENNCRDALAEKLFDKLHHYGSISVDIEAASSGGTRADIKISAGDFYVPIEAKRTDHTHLWFGHSGQLQTYTLAQNTEAQGIYLVFWFGDALKVTPPPTQINLPATSDALQAALESMLQPELRNNTSVLVLDVSDASDAAKKRKEGGFEQAKADNPRSKRKTARSTP